MSDMNKIIGKNMERARIIRKISMSEAAARLGISKNKLNDFESGRKFQPDEILSDISRLLGVSINFLFSCKQNSGQIIRMKPTEISIRDKASVVEIAKYRVSLLEPFISISIEATQAPVTDEFELTSAADTGKKIACMCLSDKTLSSFLKNNGIWVDRIQSDTAFFKGLYIRENRTNFIMIPEKYIRSDEELLHILAHELCHAFIFEKKQKSTNDHTDVEFDEELFCSEFSESFSDTCLSSTKFQLGNVDFMKEEIISAWQRDKITTSLAAELMNVSFSYFKEHWDK